MSHTHVPGVAAPSSAYLTERDNARAVDLIERAERSAPYCLCGRHMIAVAEADSIVLACSSRTEVKTGLAGLVGRFTALGHTRQTIMELPA